MRRSVAGRWLVLSSLAFLAACGGGGGGSGGGGSSPKLSLGPSPLVVTAQEFSAASVTLTGSVANSSTSSNPAYFRVTGSASAFDAQPVITGTFANFSVTAHTLPWLSAGVHTGTITVAACTDSQCMSTDPTLTTSLPYTITVSPSAQAVHRLQPSAIAVALASTPLGTVLSRSLTVHDNFGLGTGWTATSDSPWLSVTASGQSDATALVITANPASLPAGQDSVATITLASSSTGVTGATIHVGLWKSSTDVASLTALPGVDPTDIARDPWRPLAYVVDGGADVQVFNAHTATRVATFAGVGSQLVAVAVAPDGAQLYAMDASTSTIKVVDLATRQVVATWTMGQLGSLKFQHLAVVRPNGTDVLLVGNGTAMVNGRSLGNTGVVPGFVTAIDNGTRLYAIQANIDPTYVRSYELRWSDANGGQFFAMNSGSVSNPGGNAANGEQLAVAGDGSALALADATGGCMRLDPVTLAFQSMALAHVDGFTDAVALGAGGSIACGASMSSQATSTSTALGIYGATGATIASYPSSLAFQTGGYMATSSDGLVLLYFAFDGNTGVWSLLFAPMVAVQ